MDSRALPLLEAAGADLLWAEEIAPATLALIEEARVELAVSMFIMAQAADGDPGGRVRELLYALARARGRGVDVRVLIDDFRPEQDPFNINLIAAHTLLDLDVPVRVFRGERRGSLHSKVVVHEGRALVGSGNWSAGGLGANVEAAALVASPAVADRLLDAFDRAWTIAEPPTQLEALP